MYTKKSADESLKIKTKHPLQGVQIKRKGSKHMRKDHEHHNWGKYDILQDLEPTLGEKILEIIGSIIGGILVFGIMYIIALFAAF